MFTLEGGRLSVMTRFVPNAILLCQLLCVVTIEHMVGSARGTIDS